HDDGCATFEQSLNQSGCNRAWSSTGNECDIASEFAVEFFACGGSNFLQGCSRGCLCMCTSCSSRVISPPFRLLGDGLPGAEETLRRKSDLSSRSTRAVAIEPGAAPVTSATSPANSPSSSSRAAAAISCKVAAGVAFACAPVAAAGLLAHHSACLAMVSPVPRKRSAGSSI